MSMTEKNNQWFVVYTRPRWEKKVALTLEERGIENYCPLNKVTKKWSDRHKVVLEPLFKGYVFINIADDIKWEVKKVNGILNYVHWLGRPAIVPQVQIDTIKKFMQDYQQVEVSELSIDKNSRVRIRQGLLMHHEGMVLQESGAQAKVHINSLGITLTATFQKANLQVLPGKKDLSE